MTELKRLTTRPSTADQVLALISRPVFATDLESLDAGLAVELDLQELGSSAADDLGNSVKESDVDLKISKSLHQALLPVISARPALIGEAGLWEWLALDPFRDYFLERWCGGKKWLDDPSLERPKDASLLRARVVPASVKSQARHAILRLYIYADCAYTSDTSYSTLSLLFEMDQDINTAIFERRLGLSPGLSMHLAEAATSIDGPGRRARRRAFFREVNLMMSTVSPEYLLMTEDGEQELETLLQNIADAV
jgi:hypothetical protein